MLNDFPFFHKKELTIREVGHSDIIFTSSDKLIKYELNLSSGFDKLYEISKI